MSLLFQLTDLGNFHLLKEYQDFFFFKVTLSPGNAMSGLEIAAIFARA